MCMFCVSCVPHVLLQWKYLKRLALCSLHCLVNKEHSDMLAASCSLLLLSYIGLRGWETRTVLGPEPTRPKRKKAVDFPLRAAQCLGSKTTKFSPWKSRSPCPYTSFNLICPVRPHGPAALVLLSGTEVRGGLSVKPLAIAAFQEDVRA